jgi:ABC-type nitrate/sulfonate/bicarbonate transport system ATPase subunit
MTLIGAHPPHDLPGVDPLNLWGNAREGSDVPIQLQTRAQPAIGGTVHGGPVAEPAAVALEHVGRTYAQATSRGRRRPRCAGVHALADVSLHAAPGELVAVVGPSGCGKSTLLELICGLQIPDSGQVACAPAVLMPQRDLLLAWLSALDNAALGLRIAGMGRLEARAQASALFAELGLEGFEQARPHELSGGMRQRVAFVRTLLSGKPVLCLDEPFGALDAITRADMQEWLTDALAQAPRTVVLVTHDVEEAVLLADRVLVLSPRPGRVVAELTLTSKRPRRRLDARVLDARERALAALAAGGRT